MEATQAAVLSGNIWNSTLFVVVKGFQLTSNPRKGRLTQKNSME